MNNYYKELEKEFTAFKTYLLSVRKISEATASDYIKRLITICKEEEISVEELTNNIEKICFEYTEGEKVELGKRSHNSYRSALIQYRNFVTSNSNNAQNKTRPEPEYHIVIEKVPNEHFGTIKLLDKNNKLIALDVSLSKEMVSTNELGNDMFTKCLDMIFRTIYKDTYNKQLEIIKNLNISLTMDGKKIY